MQNPVERPRVVIVGGGFGGLETVRRLAKVPVQVSLVDRRNFHLFQPLLYQVATGALSPANIASPLRAIVRKQKNCEVVLGEVTGFSPRENRVLLKQGSLPYDFLVVAAGSSHSYFGHDEWERFAPGLKTIEDATEMRRRIFTAFELAELETNAERRQGLLTFVVVGGGPTGVELAGALAEISRHTLTRDFRRIDPSQARIIIVEAGDRVLAHYPAELSERGRKQIERLGITVRTRTLVTCVCEDRVVLKTESGVEELPTFTVLWGAGVQASPLGKCLGMALNVECDRAGRVPVNPDLTVGRHQNLFVIGDLANCSGESGKPLPGLAPVAMQQGRYVAKVIGSHVKGQTKPVAFRYRDRGSMATIGRSVAVAKIGDREYCGTFAWMLWLVVHLMEIVQFQNRLLVLTQWIWNYLTFNRSARLITQIQAEDAGSVDHSNSASASRSLPIE